MAPHYCIIIRWMKWKTNALPKQFWFVSWPPPARSPPNVHCSYVASIFIANMNRRVEKAQIEVKYLDGERAGGSAVLLAFFVFRKWCKETFFHRAEHVSLSSECY